MWCAVFGDGLEVPDGICRQQNRPVVGRLNQRPMLPRRMPWKGEHHDASVAKDIPALAELGMVDGPSEVHKVTVARTVLRDYEAAPGLFPSYHTPAQREKAMKMYGHFLTEQD